MTFRLSLASAVAAALVFGAVSTASAQTDTTRRATSQQRVRVTKESSGEVATKRDSAFIRDSIARIEAARRDSAARADSLANLERMRRDSIARDSSARADSAARAAAVTTPPPTTDTVRSPVLPSMSSDSYGTRRNGWYLGLGGGAAVPTGTMSDFYKAGFGVTVPIGWQPPNAAFGIRFDLGYSRFNGKSAENNALGFQPDDPNIWSATGNLTLDLLKFGESRRGALYLVGGGGVYRFTDFFSGDRTDNETESAFEGKPTTKGGLTGGAGLAFPIGGASVFVETRYTNAFTEGNNTRWVPVMLGLKWR